MKVINRVTKGGVSRQKSLRPTTGKVKEALFNILRGKIENTRFLDLYAGTGAVGMEALRQGASEVVFVEANKGYTKNINQLIKKFGFTEKANIMTKKVLSFIKWAELRQMTFDIIFLDPPYHTDEVIHVLSEIDKSHILRQEGIVIAEHFVKRRLPERFDKLQRIKDYKYGDTVLSFYRCIK
jgi:16S rRNA (guanine(966)-N(2))-methyltransferase RsmD